MEDFEALILVLMARVDQVAAEIKDPETTEERRKQLFREARALYDVLIKL